jgi:LacI family transcriptional regulator
MSDSSGPATQARPTLRDVAALAGVDASVVSRVLTDDPVLAVTSATRRRVLEAVELLGYRPNMQARGLRLRRTWTLGFVLPDINNPVYAQIVDGAHARAAEAGYALAIGSPSDEQGIDPAFERLLMERRFDGLLVASGHIDDQRVAAIAAGPTPVVVVNRRVDGIGSSVIVDDRRGAQLATQHLLELGHVRLAHIGGPSGVDTSVRRATGFLETVAHAELPEPMVVHTRDFRVESGHAAATLLLDATPRPTAVFAASVMLALGTVHTLRERHMDVPGDVSIVALHDYPLAEFVEPPLTTVAMPLGQLGAQAIDAVLARIDGAPVAAEIVSAPPRLITRRSTAPPP